jgi:hypothetical protein
MHTKYIFTVMHHKLLKTLQTTLPHSTIIMMEFGEQLLLLIQKNINTYIDETERRLQGHNRHEYQPWISSRHRRKAKRWCGADKD